MAVSMHQNLERTDIVKPLEHSLTDAQLAVVREAAARPSRALEPLLHRIRGAAWQAVVDALVARGYAIECFFPFHVEYVLTDSGMAAAESQVARRN
ncbi:hypothetical protein D5047_05770 [Verminephrobacter eiseniae]|nr:hypothetical protein [Verminephrobacter eiseniae]